MSSPTCVYIEIICDLACDACERKLRAIRFPWGGWAGGWRYFHRVDVKLDAWLYECKHTIAEQTERAGINSQPVRKYTNIKRAWENSKHLIYLPIDAAPRRNGTHSAHRPETFVWLFHVFEAHTLTHTRSRIHTVSERDIEIEGGKKREERHQRPTLL